MKTCKACGTKARKLYRAIVLSPSNRATPGNVCATCKRLGWLLVFSEPPVRTVRKGGIAAVRISGRAIDKWIAADDAKGSK